MKKFVTWCAALLSVAVLQVPSGALAASPGCDIPNSQHCYAIMQGGNTTSPLRYGMYGTWNRAEMTAGCTTARHRFADSEMWFSQADPTKEGWVEVGHTAGWLDPSGAEPGSCGHAVFAAWQSEDGVTYREAKLGSYVPDDSVTDEFKISRAPAVNTFKVQWNGRSVSTTNVQFWSARQFQMGGEVATPAATSHTFHMVGRGLDLAGNRSLISEPRLARIDNPPLRGSTPASSSWTWWVNP